MAELRAAVGKIESWRPSAQHSATEAELSKLPGLPRLKIERRAERSRNTERASTARPDVQSSLLAILAILAISFSYSSSYSGFRWRTGI
jgi:hypothetical protein